MAAAAPIKAFVFDAYGTLFDVHSPAAKVASQIGPNAAAFSALWRQKQIEYTWLRSLMGAHADFWRAPLISASKSSTSTASISRPSACRASPGQCSPASPSWLRLQPSFKSHRCKTRAFAQGRNSQ